MSSTRVGSGSRGRVQGTPPDVCVPSVLAWRRSRRRHRLAPRARDPVFRGPSGSWPGLPVPLADRVTLRRPVRMSDGTRPAPVTVNRVIHELCRARRGFVDNSVGRGSRRPRRPAVRRARRSARRTARSSRATSSATRTRASVSRRRHPVPTEVGPGRTRTNVDPRPARSRRRGRRPSPGQVAGDRQAEARCPVIRSWPAIR